MANIVEELKDSPCTKLCHQGYEPPTHTQIKALRKYLGLSQIKVGQLFGLQIRPDSRPNKGKYKDCPAVAQWECATPSRRTTIPYSSWRIMLHLAGVIDLQKDLELL